MSEARVWVSVTEGVLEFEGPEHFVAGLVEKFTSVIQTALAGEPPETTPAVASVNQVASPPEPAPDVAFKDLFAATETGVQILRTLPGSTKAQRAVNLAKLYLYGLQALKQRDTAFFAEIGRVCRAHGCYDTHNLAAYLKADRASFVFGGTGKRQTLKLSAPGMEGTAALIAGIRAGGNGIASESKGIRRHAIQARFNESDGGRSGDVTSADSQGNAPHVASMTGMR
jgi:hypothetical protein